MNWITYKILKWLQIDLLAQRIKDLRLDLCELREIIKKRTEYHIDVHQFSNSQVILIGKFHNRDFIHHYSIKDQSLIDLIKHCKELEKYAHKGKIDTLPEFQVVIDRAIENMEF